MTRRPRPSIRKKVEEIDVWACFLQEANYCIFQQVNNVKSNQRQIRQQKPRRSRLLKEIKKLCNQ